MCITCGKKEEEDGRKRGEQKHDELLLKNFYIFVELPWSKGVKTSHLRESPLLSHHEIKHLFKTTLKDTCDLVWFSFPVSQAFLLLSLYFVSTFLPPVKLHSIPVAVPSSHEHVGSIRFQRNSTEGNSENQPGTC